jgi:arylsulfatase A-like enzyme/Flp pilus assembly protein TadD
VPSWHAAAADLSHTFWILFNSLRRFVVLGLAAVVVCGCSGRQPESPSASARNLVLITIDTLRADRVGAYGYAAARTPAIDALAVRGARFERAFATAPITLPSHASILSGLYPRGHGARHNGIPVGAAAPLITETFARAGLATGAFVTAFPLDRRFGLNRGFSTYSDRLPRIAGRVSNERPGAAAVDEAIAWLNQHRHGRFFLWLHLFEPHAPYGMAGDTRPASARYDDDVAEADRQVGRLVGALGADAERTVVVVAGDHGEAFGEHGEIAHSIFVYDTTLRVPLILAGPGIDRIITEVPVSVVDIAPTVTKLMNVGTIDADGVDLGPALRGEMLPARTLYAESFAPLLDFGWSPLRAVRLGTFKYIEAPRPELYRLDRDPGETRELFAQGDVENSRTAELKRIVESFSPATLTTAAPADREAAARLQSLGYVGGGRNDRTDRADPKDMRELAADIAQATSGDLQGPELEKVLRRILSRDPKNPQGNLRLGYVLQASGRCGEAIAHFRRAIAGSVPGPEAHLGVAGCQAAAKDFDAATKTVREAERTSPDDPMVQANLGIVLSDGGRPADGVAPLERALQLDPDFHEARFNLAVAYARLGRRPDAAREATELLRRLPPGAPQRGEVERLLAAVR